MKSLRIYSLEPYSLYQTVITPELFLNGLEPTFKLSVKKVNYIDTLYDKMLHSRTAVIDREINYERFEGRILVSFYCGDELIDYMFFNPKGTFMRMNKGVVYSKDNEIISFLKTEFGLRYYFR